MRILAKATMLAVLLFAFYVPRAAQAAEVSNLYVAAAILVDADTGQILYEKNAAESLGVASMTKVMTEYLLFEAIAEGQVTWDQEYTATEFTAKLSGAPRLSNVPLRAGVTYSIRELYEAMAIYSANAATVGIAETIAGTEGAFVRLMNEKASELGLEGVRFVNSTGLSNSDMMGNHPEGTGPDEENVMTARAVAQLTKKLLEDYPEVLETAGLAKKVFREGTPDEREMKNWNFMLEGLSYEYEGVTGLKTGTTNFAGYCFTGTAERDGRRLIAVVMDAVDSNGTGSYDARFTAAKKLFDFGFNEFTEKAVPAGYQFNEMQTIPVEKGKKEEVAIAVTEPLKMFVHKNETEIYKPQLELEPSVADTGFLEAAVSKGQPVGTVQIVSENGTGYGFLDGKTVSAPVATIEQVERAGWLTLLLEKTGDFLSSMKSYAENVI